MTSQERASLIAEKKILLRKIGHLIDLLEARENNPEHCNSTVVQVKYERRLERLSEKVKCINKTLNIPWIRGLPI